MQENSIKLKVVDSTGSETFALVEKPMFTIGRRAENDLQINDAYVSRHHAEIVRQETQFKLIDKDSKHGTYVNGEKIQTTILKHNDKIQFGNNDLPCIIVLTKDEPGEEAHPQFHASGTSMVLTSFVPTTSGNDLKNVSRLLEIARLLSGGVPLGEVLDLVLDIAIEVTGAGRGFVVLKDEKGEPRFQRGRDQSKKSLPEADFQISRTVVKGVLERGEKMIMTDSLDNPGFSGSESIVNLELRTIVCLPLRRFEIQEASATAAGKLQEVFGVMYLDSKTVMGTLSKISQGILDSLAADATAVIENARLLKEYRQKERLELELNTAREIQSALLPRIEGSYQFFGACAHSIPSRHISGDYYDLFPLPDGSYGFVIADVSGKGVSAAILSSMVQGILLAEAPKHLSLAECVNAVNLYIVKKTSSDKFVTFFYGTIDQQGILRYVNAGHNPPMIVHQDGGVEELEESDIVLGAFDFSKYTDRRTKLEPGDTICLYTDGITEAKSKSGEMFGEERLTEILVKKKDLGVDEIVDEILLSVSKHSEDAGQYDDLTIFLLRYI
jgi:sigma-B regulation protein RsbU (phosphoserine phosphatase)